MPANIIIKIKGDKDTADTLNFLSKEFKNTSVPLDQSSRKYLNAISANFRDEGRTFGEAWSPLSKATIAIKRELRKQGKSIGVTKPLYRTGLMRRSFDFNLTGKNLSRIYNAQAYAQIHQEGGSVDFKGRQVRVPRRVLAAVDNARISMVAITFEQWIKKLIDSKRAGKN